MKIIDQTTMRECRERNCEICGSRKLMTVHAHHLFCRGFGGGHRMDVRIFLMAACYFCHDEIHAGHILKATVLQIVAKREHCTPADLQAAFDALKRIPRRPQSGQVDRVLAELCERARKMVVEILESQGVATCG